jgi:hypothetical protein
MPKIKKPPPKGILDHLVKRYREGRISSSDFLELKHWLESDPTYQTANGTSASRTAPLRGMAKCLPPFYRLVWLSRVKKSRELGAASPGATHHRCRCFDIPAIAGQMALAEVAAWQ